MGRFGPERAKMQLTTATTFGWQSMTTVIMYLRRVVKFLSRNPKFQLSYASTGKELVYSCWRLSRVWSSLWQLCSCFELPFLALWMSERRGHWHLNQRTCLFNVDGIYTDSLQQSAFIMYLTFSVFSIFCHRCVCDDRLNSWCFNMPSDHVRLSWALAAVGLSRGAWLWSRTMYTSFFLLFLLHENQPETQVPM